jgi:hypothetical protein
MKTKMELKDKATGETFLVDYTVTRDEVRPLSFLPFLSPCHSV